MKTENPITPVFGTDEEARVAPKYEMPEGMMPAKLPIKSCMTRPCWMVIHV